MKRFLKVFIPLVGIVLGIQLLCILLYRWTDGNNLRYLVLGLPFVLLDIFPEWFFGRVFHDRRYFISKNPNPLLLCGMIGTFLMLAEPRPYLFIVLGIDILLVAASALWAIREQKRKMIIFDRIYNEQP
ncbi:MAG: hypothetical protein IKV62_03105 [Bacteroidales bacterium]|nr:hypothetical protein [Bacteroidales bacterium]